MRPAEPFSDDDPKRVIVHDEEGNTTIAAGLPELPASAETVELTMADLTAAVAQSVLLQRRLLGDFRCVLFIRTNVSGVVEARFAFWPREPEEQSEKGGPA